MTSSDNTVAIVGGTGALGSALALRLAGAGINVRIGSRRIESAESAAGELVTKLNGGGGSISGHLNSDAVGGASIVFLTVPLAAQVENLKQLKDSLTSGQLLVDATVPLAAATGGKPTRTIALWQGSAAQQAQELVPDGVVVVSALHSVSAVTLADPDPGAEVQDVLVMSDVKSAKARVAALIDLISGLRAVDGGPLEAAQIAEQLTALLIGLNIRYKTHAGVRFTDLPPREWK
jgi:NADPH-dependent F420 reductase